MSASAALRRCTACEQQKPPTSFDRNSQRVGGGLLRQCRDCVNAKRRERYASDPPPSASPGAARRYRERHPDRVRDAQRRSKYRLKPGEYEQRVADQDGQCAICQRVPTGSLQVDHCHATGAVRGLLCGSCNKALGLLGDDTTRLESALRYLSPPG